MKCNSYNILEVPIYMYCMYNIKETTFITKNKDKKLKRKICIFCIFFSISMKLICIGRNPNKMRIFFSFLSTALHIYIINENTFNTK
jgi:hypothetical protein